VPIEPDDDERTLHARIQEVEQPDLPGCGARLILTTLGRRAGRADRAGVADVSGVRPIRRA